MRQPLDTRGSWTLFESALFNLFTRLSKEETGRFLFSKRLRIVQAMLDAMDAEVAVIKAEQEAGMH